MWGKKICVGEGEYLLEDRNVRGEEKNMCGRRVMYLGEGNICGERGIC